jgi:hypothetical protein
MEPCIANVFVSTTNKMQHYTMFFVVVSAVHVAWGTCQTCVLLLLVVTTHKFGKYPMLHV